MTAVVVLRALLPPDRDALYAICLATGDRGRDAAHLYQDRDLIGHIYAGPYARLSPESCFVAEDDAGVGGYLVGALDSRRFEARLELDWWPGLRRRYPEPSGDPAAWNADQRRCHLIHHPRRVPEEVARSFPAHLHMNLLPRQQGRGIGTALLNLWISYARQQDCRAVHVAAGATNPHALGFWQSRGFAKQMATSDHGSSGALWLGRRID